MNAHWLMYVFTQVGAMTITSADEHPHQDVMGGSNIYNNSTLNSHSRPVNSFQHVGFNARINHSRPVNSFHLPALTPGSTVIIPMGKNRHVRSDPSKVEHPKSLVESPARLSLVVIPGNIGKETPRSTAPSTSTPVSNSGSVHRVQVNRQLAKPRTSSGMTPARTSSSSTPFPPTSMQSTLKKSASTERKQYVTDSSGTATPQDEQSSSGWKVMPIAADIVLSYLHKAVMGAKSEDPESEWRAIPIAAEIIVPNVRKQDSNSDLESILTLNQERAYRLSEEASMTDSGRATQKFITTNPAKRSASNRELFTIDKISSKSTSYKRSEVGIHAVKTASFSTSIQGSNRVDHGGVVRSAGTILGTISGKLTASKIREISKGLPDHIDNDKDVAEPIARVKGAKLLAIPTEEYKETSRSREFVLGEEGINANTSTLHAEATSRGMSLPVIFILVGGGCLVLLAIVVFFLLQLGKEGEKVAQEIQREKEINKVLTFQKPTFSLLKVQDEIDTTCTVPRS